MNAKYQDSDMGCEGMFQLLFCRGWQSKGSCLHQITVEDFQGWTSGGSNDGDSNFQ